MGNYHNGDNGPNLYDGYRSEERIIITDDTKHTSQHHPGLVKSTGPEKYPGDIHQEESQ